MNTSRSSNDQQSQKKFKIIQQEQLQKQELTKSYSVKIYLYDLSGGIVKTFSPMLLGKQIEGIWHTGLVIYNKEFYFGGGICEGTPKQTPYGHPIREIDMGTTEILEYYFKEKLAGIKDQYTVDTYDLFKRNCNNFIDECLYFLTNQHLPSYIMDLPQEIIKSPIGSMICPILQDIEQKVKDKNKSCQLFQEIPILIEGEKNQDHDNFNYSMALVQNSKIHKHNKHLNKQKKEKNEDENEKENNDNNIDNQEEVKSEIAEDICRPKHLEKILIENLINEVNLPQLDPNPEPPSPGQFLHLMNKKKNKNQLKKFTINVENFEHYINLIPDLQASVLLFYENNNENCVNAIQNFEKISNDFQEKCPQIKFLLLDREKNQDVALDFNIQQVPFYVGMYQGEIKFSKTSNNKYEIKSFITKMAAQIKLN